MNQTDRGRLLLVDGHSLAYRAFFALPVENFSTTTGQPTNAVYGFTAMLINALRDEKPTHAAAAFDVSRRTFRTDRYPEYKANRAESPREFPGQIDFIKEVLAAMGIPAIQWDDVEADDVIATLARRAADGGMDVLILSGDRDVLQLVSDRITVLYPRRGVSDVARMTPAAVIEKYGITPEQYPDLAAIVGETSDNLPGVPGVGPGFAAKWLRQYGSLAGVVEHCADLPGKKGQAFRNHLEQVLLNRRLNGLVDDLPLAESVADLARAPLDRARIHEVLGALQFRVLTDRLLETLDADVARADESPRLDVRRIEAGRFGEWLRRHSGTGLHGLALDGHWGRGIGDIVGIAIAAPDGAVGWASMVDLPPEDAEALSAWLADPSIAKAVHDAKGPLLAFRKLGWTPAGLVVDTALAAYLVLPGQRSFDLADLSSRFLHRELVPAREAGEQLLLGGGGDEEAGRMGSVAVAVADLAAELLRILDDRGGRRLLADVELPLESVLADMEAVGIAVDVPQLRRLESEFGDRMRGAESRAHQLAGRPFNLGSPKQLQEILFGERGLPKTKRIKTGYTTDAEALQSLFAKTEDPLLAELLGWRDVSRMRQTVAGLIPLADAAGRIHTTFNQTIAATGRLSSADPNLQNIPVRTEEGRRIRAAFVVGEGFDALLTADYSQIEMRIMAHLSQDRGLIDAFRAGEDLHTTVASQVFGRPPGEVDPEMRRRIKAMSYGLAYGLSAFGLGAQLGVSPEEARALMETYFTRFGGVRDYLHEVVERARATGYTETLLGRRRYLPDLTSDNRMRREMAERMALNAPIQGSAADIIKVAMIDIHRAFRRSGLRSRILLQVHDELVVEIAPGEREPATDLVRDLMQSAVTLSVPLRVSTGSGSNWEAAAH